VSNEAVANTLTRQNRAPLQRFGGSRIFIWAWPQGALAGLRLQPLFPPPALPHSLDRRHVGHHLRSRT
jgi:hypothetical protein